MTSISSVGSYQPQSPLDALENELSSEVSNGTISASDESALSTALTDINNTLQSDASSSSSPGDIKSKINDLIEQQVQNGTLTTSQASELQNVFANTFSHGGPGGPDGAGASSSSDGSNESTPSDSSASTALQELLKLLKDASTTTTGYDASGQTSSATLAAVVNYQS